MDDYVGGVFSLIAVGASHFTYTSKMRADAVLEL